MKKTTTGITKKAPNNIVHQVITRPKELFLMFWVDENYDGRKMFSEAAQTRMNNIKKEEWYDEKIHKIHCPPIQSLDEINKIIISWVNIYDGADKAKVREIGIFSHAALDGPIAVFASNVPPVPNYPSQMAISGGWDSIDFNWAPNNAKCVFYGCNSGLLNIGFAQRVSALANFKNVTVWGQDSSTYPSFYPDKRVTTAERTIDLGWDIGETYMVGGSQDQGAMALTPGLEPDAIPFNFFLNGKIIGSSHQGIFNDHRKNM